MTRRSPRRPSAGRSRAAASGTLAPRAANDRDAPAASRGSAFASRAWCVIPALAALVVWWGSTRYFFTQDDFGWLDRSIRGGAHVEWPWRWLSLRLWFDAMHAAFGPAPMPWHVAQLALHAAASAALFGLLARRVTPPAALFGAVLYATHPAPFTAIYWVSGISEVLAACFAVLAWRVATGAPSHRGYAVPLYLAALLGKETVLLLPLVVALELRLAPPRDRAGAPVPGPGMPVLAMGAVGLAFAATLVARDLLGVRTGADAAAPYSLSLRAMPGNLASYLAWTVELVHPLVKSFTDRRSPGHLVVALIVAAAWSAGLLDRRLRRSGWAIGAAAFAAFLLPVLPLANHTYHYYLLAPLLGASLVAAAAFDRLAMPAPGGIPRARGRRAAWVAAVVAAALAVNGAALVRKIERHPYVDPRLRADATIDRARIAERVMKSLRAADLPPGTRLAFWSPTARAGATPQAPETYYERNVRAALYDGLGVRLLFPGIAEVEFTRGYASRPAPWRWAVYQVDGDLRVATSAELDSVLPRYGLGPQ